MGPSTGSRRVAKGCSAALVVLATAAVLLQLSDPLCDNRLVSDVASPDGGRHAVVFHRDCGFINTHSTHVSVLPRWRSWKRYGGNVFVADGNIVPAPSGPGGQPRVAVRWLDRRTLEVRYDHRARVLDKPVLLDEEIDVHFVPDSTPPASTDGY
jgi:hypothetical protein